MNRKGQRKGRQRERGSHGGVMERGKEKEKTERSEEGEEGVKEGNEGIGRGAG